MSVIRRDITSKTIMRRKSLEKFKRNLMEKL